jgi:hypothetical protein
VLDSTHFDGKFACHRGLPVARRLLSRLEAYFFCFASQDVFIRTFKGVALAWVAALAASLCVSSPVASSAATRELTNNVTIQELMATQIDPSADALWASVSTVITTTGVQEKQPRTEVEWRTVRRQALMLIQGATLLAGPSRRVAVPEAATEDSAIPGIETPENIQKAIDADRASFVMAAVRLRDAAIEALRAVDQRDPQGLIEAGGNLDAACEACHLKYWYPHSPRPK